MNFVTGAGGHIGNVLVRRLLAQGEPVRAMLAPGESRQSLQGLDVEVVEADIRQPEAVRRALGEAERVYHLAGMISILPGRDDRVQQVNVQGTRNVIRAACQAGVKRLVYTSSIHALSRAPHGVTIDEQIPFDPQHAISAYDQSKAEASLLVQDAACLGLDAVLICPTGVIGPYDFRGSEMGEVIRDAVYRRVQFVVNGTYDFVDVRDVAEGLTLAAEKGRSGESYILSGEQLSLSKLLDLVQSVTGMQHVRLPVPLPLARLAAQFGPLYARVSKSKPRLTPYSIETVTSNSVISHAKARQELGYAPRPLHQTIYDTVQWLAEQHAGQRQTA